MGLVASAVAAGSVGAAGLRPAVVSERVEIAKPRLGDVTIARIELTARAKQATNPRLPGTRSI
jgi:hypothetical protein